MLEDKLSSTIIKEGSALKEAMKSIDNSGLGLCIIIDEQRKIKGILTDGDIRRSILEGYSVDIPVDNIMNKNPITLKGGCTKEELIKKAREEKIVGKIPIIDEEERITDLAIIPEPEIKFLSKTGPEEKGERKILITGGSGYLGSILTRKLLERGYKVKAIDNLLYGEESIKELKGNPDFELIKGDIRHIENITKNIQDIQAVIHLAGIVGDPACGLSSEQTIEQNLLATMNIAQICKHFQINRFIFASSCSVYGESDDLLTEESELNPISLYARDKIESEKAILNLVDENFSPTILRMGTLYGASPRPRFDLVLNTITAYAVKERKFSIFGGEQWRPMIHVDDAAEAYIKVLEAPLEKIRGEIFNVGSEEENLKIIELGKKVKEIIPEAELMVEDKEVDLRNYKVSCQKIKNQVGFTTKKRIEDGIKEIKQLLEKDQIIDFKDKIHNNHAFLKKL